MAKDCPLSSPEALRFNATPDLSAAEDDAGPRTRTCEVSGTTIFDLLGISPPDPTFWAEMIFGCLTRQVFLSRLLTSTDSKAGLTWLPYVIWMVSADLSGD